MHVYERCTHVCAAKGHIRGALCSASSPLTSGIVGYVLDHSSKHQPLVTGRYSVFHHLIQHTCVATRALPQAKKKVVVMKGQSSSAVAKQKQWKCS